MILHRNRPRVWYWAKIIHVYEIGQKTDCLSLDEAGQKSYTLHLCLSEYVRENKIIHVYDWVVTHTSVSLDNSTLHLGTV